MRTRFFTTLFLTMTVTGLTFMACNKDDDNDDNNGGGTTSDPANLEVHYHAKVGNSGFDLGSNYTMDVGGETITYSFSYAAFYVSQITLDKMGGGSTSFPDRYLLVKPAQDDYEVGELEAVHYTGISFNIGVDSATNHLDPATYADDHPLAFQDPSMHWNWDPGYRFISLEGNYSATSGESGSFTFHIGLDAFLSNVNLTFTEHMMVEDGKDEVIHMEVDYAALLEGVDLRTENFTKAIADSEKPLAQKLSTTSHLPFLWSKILFFIDGNHWKVAAFAATFVE